MAAKKQIMNTFDEKTENIYVKQNNSSEYVENPEKNEEWDEKEELKKWDILLGHLTVQKDGTYSVDEEVVKWDKFLESCGIY